MPAGLQISLFVVGTIFLAYVSRNSLRQPRSHGFYRFLAWETLLLMCVRNAPGWFHEPWAWYQLLSWALLLTSMVLAVVGLQLLRAMGQQDAGRRDPALFGMEKTSRLVTGGLYRYIRHPLYSSLLFLAWGLFCKSPSWLDAGLALLCTGFLVATARMEEHENVAYFGAAYASYMARTKMFVPFVF